MPDVFERFLMTLIKTEDYYSLLKLSLAYQVYFGKNDSITIADNLQDIITTFEKLKKELGKVRNFYGYC